MPKDNIISMEQAIRRYLKENKIVSVHLEGCECLTCTYDYPNKEHMIELKHSTASMAMRQLGFKKESELLALILTELRSMRQQEKDYWETWKQAKNTEQKKEKYT